MSTRPPLPVLGAAPGDQAPALRPEAADPALIQAVWMRVFMDGLRRAGITDVVVSPGSRSTPLVLAAEFTGLACHTIIDERSAGFFALGRARLTGLPVALVCTSGTAGAHYYPAVIEAAYAHLPLVVITADRPPELQGCAAPQTIDQAGLFGGMVRHFVDLGTPAAERARLRAARRKAIQAVALARAPVPGPVHVNAPARKPLEPVPPRTPADLALMERGDAVCAEPAPRVVTGPPRIPDASLDALASACLTATRGLIACGPMPPHWGALGRAARQLAEITGFPLLAEAASQARFTGAGTMDGQGDGERLVICDGFDALLACARFRRHSQPELVLQIGPPPTSRGFAALMSENPEAVCCVIAPWGWNDPQSSADMLLLADPADALEGLVDRLRARQQGAGAPGRTARAAWSERFAAGNALVWRAVDQALDATGAMREGQAVRAAIDALPGDALLALGNSLAIRTVDAYCRAREHGPPVLSQRGANGIDGTISAAAGAASAGARPLAVILGDVSFAHDLGGLAAARHAGPRAPLAVIVIDNQGGRIFEQLPVAERGGELFAARWLTPPGCDVRAAAAVFGHAYARAEDPGALARAVAAALRPGAGCTVIHAVVVPESAAQDQQRIQALVDAGADALPAPDAAAAGARDR